MKRITFGVIMLVLVLILTACGNNAFEEVAMNGAGKYHLFTTGSNEKYLMFLEAFDDEKYEIVDISMNRYYWNVTYKDVG